MLNYRYTYLDKIISGQRGINKSIGIARVVEVVLNYFLQLLYL